MPPPFVVRSQAPGRRITVADGSSTHISEWRERTRGHHLAHTFTIVNQRPFWNPASRGISIVLCGLSLKHSHALFRSLSCLNTSGTTLLSANGDVFLFTQFQCGEFPSKVGGHSYGKRVTRPSQVTAMVATVFISAVSLRSHPGWVRFVNIFPNSRPRGLSAC